MSEKKQKEQSDVEYFERKTFEVIDRLQQEVRLSEIIETFRSLRNTYLTMAEREEWGNGLTGDIWVLDTVECALAKMYKNHENRNTAYINGF